jgi:uncharacterized RDD family membrane protein YckC
VSSQEITPGWYKDPVEPGVQRYWDGEGWIGDPVPADAPTPVGPPVVTTPPPAGTWSLTATQPVATPVPPAPEPPVSAPPTAGPVGPATPLPPGVVLPPGAIVLPPGTPPPPGMFPDDKLPPGAIPVLLPGPVPRMVPIVPAAALPHGLPVAPMWSRLVARLIDIAIVLVLNVIVNGWFIYEYAQEIAPQLADARDRWLAGQAIEPLPGSSRQSYLEIVIIVLAAALWFAYEVPAIAGNGQTLGKRLMRIKVMRLESTEPIGFGRAIRRWNLLGLWTFLWYCGIGFLVQIVVSLSPLFDWPLRRGIHDRSAATVVVRVADAQQPAEQPDSDGTQSAAKPGETT